MMQTDGNTETSRSWDWPLLAITAVLAGLGLLMILSASSLNADARYGDAMHYVTRQLVGMGIGGLGALAILVAPWSWLRRAAWPSYLVTVVLMALVMSPLGYSANGATRWISLGPVNLQPSEFAKLAMVVIMAHYLSCNEGRLRDVVGVVVPGLTLMAPLLVLVIYQRDFGTTVILLGLAGVLLFVAGLQWRYIFGLMGGAAAMLTMLIVVEPFRIRRLMSFLDPFADPDGAGYQVVQGWIALATGGLTGAGLASGVAQRGFLPEAHTDFIVAVIGEELGAIGWTLTVLLLVGLIWRGIVIATRSDSLFGMLVAVGISSMFAAQAIINIGVVGGVLPAKGLVLPFLSYGASAAMLNTLCVGILLRISLETDARVEAGQAKAPESLAGVPA
jgi:cell division protein FtsW